MPNTATAERPWLKKATHAPKPATVAKAAPAPAAKPAPAAATTEAPPKAGGNIAPLVDEYAATDKQIKALEKTKKTIGEQIKALGVGEYNGTRCKLVVSSFNSTRLDSDAIRAAFSPDVVAKFEKTSITTKLDIKPLL